jgi:L-seryl-tRNA(Ser) seleniumtransferase
VRADKLCLAGLAVTLTHYLKDEAERKIPVWMMISMPLEMVRQRAEYWRTALQHGEIVPGFSTVGGGSLPEETLPTWLLAVESKQPNRFLSRLREAQPAIIARILNDRVVLDPRTVLLEQESAFLTALKAVLYK